MNSSVQDDAVRVEVYRSFIENGRPPVPMEIAQALSVDQKEAESSLRRLADGHVLVLAPGTPYIWMANPFSALPTPFSVDAQGRTWFGNCIWDAMGIVAILGGSGSVKTWCPDCKEPMAVSIENGRVSSGDGVAHYAVPASQWWDDIGFN